MIQLGLPFQHLQLDEGAQAGEDVIGLRPDGVGRRAFERGVLLQGLVERFNRPSFVIERGDPIAGECGVAGDQKQYTDAAIFVRKDLLDQQFSI